MVPSNDCWPRAKVFSGQLLCTMGNVEMRALEDRLERRGPSASSSCKQPMNIREGLTLAEDRGRKVGVRPGTGNPSVADQEEHNATLLPFRSQV